MAKGFQVSCLLGARAFFNLPVKRIMVAHKSVIMEIRLPPPVDSLKGQGGGGGGVLTNREAFLMEVGEAVSRRADGRVSLPWSDVTETESAESCHRGGVTGSRASRSSREAGEGVVTSSLMEVSCCGWRWRWAFKAAASA